MNLRKKKRQDGFFKSIFEEIGETIFGELIINILLFIPRMLIRIIKHLF